MAQGIEVNLCVRGGKGGQPARGKLVQDSYKGLARGRASGPRGAQQTTTGLKKSKIIYRETWPIAHTRPPNGKSQNEAQFSFQK